MTTVSRGPICPLCGYSAEGVSAACGPCPTAKSCRSAACPRCGYEQRPAGPLSAIRGVACQLGIRLRRPTARV